MKTVRRALIGAGVLSMTYAAIGALADPDVKGGALLFLIGVLIAHDAILLPLVVGVGALIGRFVPLRRRALVRAALLITLAVTIVAVPLVLGAGRAADNPSLLPLNYGRGLLGIYGAIWVSAALAAAARAWKERPARTPSAP
ncbi:hypothetical protein [Actinoplanes solisilvae]|uniref:hypothetical protein n=1 Tax=Actinoplanes solisilvae TaxID=2486853 RepID=UPI000FD6C704|nr:hypothetical protein [Actinoplanes solisilvae]